MPQTAACLTVSNCLQTTILPTTTTHNSHNINSLQPMTPIQLFHNNTQHSWASLKRHMGPLPMSCYGICGFQQVANTEDWQNQDVAD